MILTLTLNPAIDMNYQLGHLTINQVNRCGRVIKTAGGKGLNVTRVLKCVNAEVLAAGFLGGKTGEFIADELDHAGVSHHFVTIKGSTRHCLAIMHEGNQTEILEDGPSISGDEAAAFLREYDRLLDQATVVTASGSLPKGLPKTFYQQLIERAARKNRKFLLDTSGESLKAGIKASPYLIKPNQDELAALMGEEAAGEAGLVASARRLAETGVRFIVVSLGKKGALGYFNGRAFIAEPPAVQAVNAVGSGDSMIAGLAYGIDRGLAPEEALAYGAAFGTLNAMEARTGYVDQAQVEAFKKKIAIRTVG
ncbi:1-phosphofructokinase [Sporolactobacillus sp. CQH2019]|uniref:1-phosphofructokinase n=1 Tax=Sporolactobacillus sp. CQH2019 TaxID=3023512 RepID=UPI002367FC4D|nr:1-phosphofructokinase [Sporolactobacillus sp. CQH2019]MDD9150648.1 1-phosphofructokinase [Sporolactobacillus sp. CQH2019]